MFEINLPSDMFDNIKNHIAGTLFIARLKGNDGKSFTLVFEPAAEQSVRWTGGTLPPSEPLSAPKPGTGVEYLSHQPTSR